MTDLRIDEFGGFFGLLVDGLRTPEILAAAALALMFIVTIILRQLRAQAAQRLHAAATAYAEREIAQAERVPARELSPSGIPA